MACLYLLAKLSACIAECMTTINKIDIFGYEYFFLECDANAGARGVAKTSFLSFPRATSLRLLPFSSNPLGLYIC